ncbi:OsmC family protein [Haoranjiania flava]|uniref:OsmC family protein n=1 Tax=Haoranjiania flava TaxID=1856322 RepID=A0AAE3LK67_9BACT|nr:OsmC family protein [Haoranjiania flava]MCU7694288.1 OsmC family protein [Haoranjiania flava]
MTSKIVYKGDLRTEMTHLQSGSTVQTDAPVDNQGRGELFSPTDLVATGLGSCMMTIMGIKAQSIDIDLTGTEMHVTKIMAPDPRRIVEIQIEVDFPDRLSTLDEKQKTIIEKAGLTCPVAKSLHPDIVQAINFSW